MRRVIVIGGGAAGFFTAINLKEKNPDLDVIILEKGSKVLQKVKVSGGGRCNVTNERTKPGELIKFYPRGGKKLYKLFERFGTKEMREWLSARSVETRAENDHRVFPISNTSQTILDCFQGTAKKLGVEVILNNPMESLKSEGGKWKVICSQEEYLADAVVLATGSSPQVSKKINHLGIQFNAGVPSLFTFHIKDARIEGLQGLSIPNVTLKIGGSKLSESGPLLITHWGVSGPAVLKLSAWGARELANRKYEFGLVVNYLSISATECQDYLKELIATHPKKKLANHTFKNLPKRLWMRILEILNLQERTFGDLGTGNINKLTEELTQAHFQVTGKSAFKEEFVTCGGVDLSEVDLKTMESKKHKGLYFGGEVLDIDALTGGFNFQACWSAGWAISENFKEA